MALQLKRPLLIGLGLGVAAVAGLSVRALLPLRAVSIPSFDSAANAPEDAANLERYRSAFAAFHRVRLQIREDYQAAPDVSLPFERIVSRLLRGVGLTVLTGQADTADLKMLVWVNGTYVMRDLDGMPVYSGADIEGSISVESDSLPQLYRAFQGRFDPNVLHTASPAYESIRRRSIQSPGGAPYMDALNQGDSSFLVVLAVLVRDISGRADAVVTTLSSWPDDEMRFSLMDAVAAVGGSAAVDQLSRIVSTRGTLAGKAARALGRLRDPRAFQPLLALLGDDNVLASDAAEALGDLGDVRAVEPLVAVLGSHEAISSSSAARALGRLRDRRAIEPLIEAMEYQDPELARDPNFEHSELRFPLRSDAMFALFEITRQNLGPDPAPWRAWHAEQTRRIRSQ